LLGLLAAAVLSGVTYFNDFVLTQSHLVGSFLPISVFGGLIIFTSLVNPLLGKINRRLSLQGRELAVVLALLFAACYVPGRGLMHYFTTLQMLPHHHQREHLSWRKGGINIVDVAPKRMLADPSSNPDKILDGFYTGLGEQHEHISFRDVPWHAWEQSLMFWLPLLLSILLGMIGLSVLMHRQWSRHERLRYPIATFAQALLPEPGHTVSSVLKSRIFWAAAAGVIVIHITNYIYAWYPDKMIHIPTEVDFGAAGKKLETFVQWGGGGDLLVMKCYFSAVGFAYLLSTDISISMGLAPFLFTWVVGILAVQGITVRQGHVLSLAPEKFLHAGAYFAMFVVLIYVGRRYYLTALRRSLFLPAREQIPPAAVWGTRVFLIGTILFAAQLAWVGLDWQLAVLYTLGTVIVFVVVSRIVAETGLFYLHSYTFPCMVLWGFLGPTAVGPKMLVIMMLVTSVLLIDPREALLPFMMNGLVLTDTKKVRAGRTASWAAVALIVAFAVAVPVTLYLQYDHGVLKAGDGWTRHVPYFPFEEVRKVRDELSEAGKLDLSNSLSGWERFGEIAPDTPCIVAFGIAAGLVFLCTVARLRFARWPLHPVMFLVLGTYQSRRMGASFLLGGLIKMTVTKLFGSSTYEKAKPAMFGLVAGELLAGIITMIVGAIYYFRTGLAPKRFMILPY
jgi:hypothetical protein